MSNVSDVLQDQDCALYKPDSSQCEPNLIESDFEVRCIDSSRSCFPCGQTAPPSIWSTATYTPLAKSQQILLTRPGNVCHSETLQIWIELWKRGPWLFRVNRGWNTTQLYGNYLYIKPLSIRILINQPVQWKVRPFFFRGSIIVEHWSWLLESTDSPCKLLVMTCSYSTLWLQNKSLST